MPSSSDLPPNDPLLMLFRRVQAGDSAAIAALPSALLPILQPMVARVLWRHRGALGGRDPRDELEDVLQEALTQLCRDDAARIRRWDESRGKPRTYLSVVARGLTLTYLARRLDEIPPTPPRPPSPGHDDERAALAKEELRRILDRLFEQLTPTERLVFDLWFVEELPARQIAELVGSTGQGVNAMTYRMRQKAECIRAELGRPPSRASLFNVVPFPRREDPDGAGKAPPNETTDRASAARNGGEK